mmetsp:Transcript_123033/g.229934  ORF Transcript_123033/g.229934 Transcript_123033/m.229934 type:complete len:182 (-) Transcript_123033:59-604(-)
MGETGSKCEGCCAPDKTDEAPMISVNQAAAYPGVSLKAPEFQEEPPEPPEKPLDEPQETQFLPVPEPEVVEVPEPEVVPEPAAPEPAEPEKPSPSTQVIEIVKNGGRVGIDVDYGDGITLVVKQVNEGGAAYKYNAANPDAPLESGDVILEINGAKGDTGPLLEKIQKDEVLRMTIRKGGA